MQADRFPDRKRFPPHVPARLRKIVANCLSVDPADRFTSAIDAANALASVEGPVLDWHLTEAAGARTWTKNGIGTRNVLVVDDAGTAGYRKRIGAGVERRVTAMCGKVSNADIAKFLSDT